MESNIWHTFLASTTDGLASLPRPHHHIFLPFSLYTIHFAMNKGRGKEREMLEISGFSPNGGRRRTVYIALHITRIAMSMSTLFVFFFLFFYLKNIHTCINLVEFNSTLYSFLVWIAYKLNSMKMICVTPLQKAYHSRWKIRSSLLWTNSPIWYFFYY